MNRDPWEVLLGCLERYNDHARMDVQFWTIPRKWNSVADAASRDAAVNEEMPERWADVYGVMNDRAEGERASRAGLMYKFLELVTGG